VQEKHLIPDIEYQMRIGNAKLNKNKDKQSPHLSEYRISQAAIPQIYRY
jgi:hypothetical protein